MTFGQSFGASAVLYLQGIRGQGGDLSDINPIDVIIGLLLALGAVRDGLTLLREKPPAEVSAAKPRTHPDISLDDITNL